MNTLKVFCLLAISLSVGECDFTWGNFFIPVVVNTCILLAFLECVDIVCWLYLLVVLQPSAWTTGHSTSSETWSFAWCQTAGPLWTMPTMDATAEKEAPALLWMTWTGTRSSVSTSRSQSKKPNWARFKNCLISCRCCEVHDQCYSDAMQHSECWPILDNPYTEFYDYSCDESNRKVTCGSKWLWGFTE